jgi:hypothetical protein
MAFSKQDKIIDYYAIYNYDKITISARASPKQEEPQTRFLFPNAVNNSQSKNSCNIFCLSSQSTVIQDWTFEKKKGLMRKCRKSTRKYAMVQPAITR